MNSGVDTGFDDHQYDTLSPTETKKLSRVRMHMPLPRASNGKFMPRNSQSGVSEQKAASRQRSANTVPPATKRQVSHSNGISSQVRVPSELRSKYDTLPKQKRRLLMLREKIAKLENQLHELRVEERQIMSLGGSELYYQLFE